jgi:hypothetical protein
VRLCENHVDGGGRAGGVMRSGTPISTGGWRPEVFHNPDPDYGM